MAHRRQTNQNWLEKYWKQIAMYTTAIGTVFGTGFTSGQYMAEIKSALEAAKATQEFNEKYHSLISECENSKSKYYDQRIADIEKVVNNYMAKDEKRKK